MRSRAVIHLNIADFAARLEACMDPGLKDRPLVVAPLGAPRAVVYDMSEQAFKEGIRKGMPLSGVRRRHPGVPVIPPRFDRYERAMKEVFKQGLAYTPAVESGAGDGHLFLDVTGTGRLYGPPPDVAFRLKKSIRRTMGLDPIWSLATNKLVAKVATRLVKPSGEYIVGPGEEAAFLGPLPVDLLPGLSGDEIRTMAQFNLVRVSQVRALTPAQMEIPFPGRAADIHRLLRGIDTAPVSQAPSNILKAAYEFATDTNEADQLRAGLASVTATLSARLRRQNLCPKRLCLAISYADGVCHTGSAPGSSPGSSPDSPTDEFAMARQAWALCQKTWKRRVRIRHLALSCTTTPAAPVQADLFAADSAPADTLGRPHRIRQLTCAIDNIRTRFGTAAVRTGATLACSP